MRRLVKSIIPVVFVTLLLTSLATAAEEKSIVSILSEDGRFTTLLAAMETTETTEAFSKGNWTLFAPTDAAFAKLGINADNVDTSFGIQELADLLLYQSMHGRTTTDDAKKMLGDITMANGWAAGLKWFAGTLWVNDDSKAIERDINAANGVIHVIDTVITPPWPRGEVDPDSALLQDLKQAAEAKAAAAKAAAEAKSEAESAADGTSTETGGGGETSADAGDTTAAPEPVVVPANSLLGVANEDGRFTTLIAAIVALDLTEPFTEGNWTLFAPTDDAFAKIGVNAANVTSEYSVGELADLLLYHAMDQTITADKAKTMLGDITMRNGRLAGLKYYEGNLWVNDYAKVIVEDIQTDNGVIHVVDSVIQPPWPRVETTVTTTTEGDPQ
jgi:transforming growth factor-beta-induced protein